MAAFENQRGFQNQMIGTLGCFNKVEMEIGTEENKAKQNNSVSLLLCELLVFSFPDLSGECPIHSPLIT